MSQTIETLNEYMLYHGQKRIGDFEFTNDFIDFIKAINELEIPEIKTKPKALSRFNLKKNAYKFFNDYYNLHDVGYLPDNKTVESLNQKELSENDFIQTFNHLSKIVSPFKLPTNHVLDSLYDGVLVTQPITTNDEEFNKRANSMINVCFSGIRLPKRSTELGTISYIHEITHTQLESNKGIVEDYYNVEVLSIFNELLFALNDYCTDSTKKVEIVNKLNTIFTTFLLAHEYKAENFIKHVMGTEVYGDYDYHSDVKYMISTLKALKMISLTLNDHVAKYHIVNLINKVYKGKMSVEELLDSLDINNESIQDTKYIEDLAKITR